MQRSTLLVLAFAPLQLLAAPPRNHVEAKEAPVYAILEGKAAAKLLLNEATGTSDLSLSVLTLEPGAVVAEHVHQTSSETLYVESGEVEMIVAGKVVRAKAGDALYVPAGTPHSARVSAAGQRVKAVQVYVGPGPEQRFAKGQPVGQGPSASTGER